jgi:hypothetical protein
MKKLTVMIISTSLVLIMMGSCFAAGSVTGSCDNLLDGIVRTVTFTWTGDSSSGAVPTKSTSAISCYNTTADKFTQGYYLCSAETSTVAGARPTTLYDIQILDALSADKMGTSLANRDSNSTQEAQPLLSAGGNGCKYIMGPLTFSLTNNSVGSASGVTTLFFSRP